MKKIKQIVERFVAKGTILEADRKKLSEGVLCKVKYPICNVGELNKNNRMYEWAVWDGVSQDQDVQDKLGNRTMFAQEEHPEEGSSTRTDRIAGIVTEIVEDRANSKVHAIFEILDTPYGRIIDTLLKANCGIGVSTRAEGELDEVEEDGKKYHRVIPEKYKLVTVDFTADPSTYGAYPESVEQNIVTIVQKGIQEEKLDQKFAITLLEGFKCKDGKCLLETLKKNESLESVLELEVDAYGKKHKVKDMLEKLSDEQASDMFSMLAEEMMQSGLLEGDLPDVTEELKKFFEIKELGEGVTLTAEGPDTMSFDINGKKYEYFGVEKGWMEKIKKMLKYGQGFNAIHWLNKFVPKKNIYRIEGEGKNMKRVPIVAQEESVKENHEGLVKAIKQFGVTISSKDGDFNSAPDEIEDLEVKDGVLYLTPRGGNVIPYRIGSWDQIGDNAVTLKAEIGESIKEGLAEVDFATLLANIKNVTKDAILNKDEQRLLKESKTVVDFIENALSLVKKYREHEVLAESTTETLKENAEGRIGEITERYATDVMEAEITRVRLATLCKEIDKQFEQFKKDHEAQVTRMVEDHQAEITEAKKSIAEKTVVEIKKVYDSKMKQLQNKFNKETKALETKCAQEIFNKTVVETAIADSGLQLPTKAVDVLKQCSSREEVNKMIAEFRVRLKESLLHSGGVSEVKVNETVPSTDDSIIGGKMLNVTKRLIKDVSKGS